MIALLALAAIAADPWTVQRSGTEARLRGVSAVDARVAWASGAGGTCLRTVDGGATWERRPVPDADGLDFRDVQAFDDRTAYLLSIGAGPLSRILKTTDGGATWAVVHRNVDPNGFLDAIAFRDAEHGLALGDPVAGRFVVLRTEDGGRTWAGVEPAGMPEALPGEGAFAASGTCLAVGGGPGGRLAWFATGGGPTGRVFRSADGGRTWAVAPAPVRGGNASSGIFSLAFRDETAGLAIGGDYKDPARSENILARTDDGGRTWTTSPGGAPRGYRSAVAFDPSRPDHWLAVGPDGADASADGGRTWAPSGPAGYHAVAFAPAAAGVAWAVGEGGRIARYDPAR